MLQLTRRRSPDARGDAGKPRLAGKLHAGKVLREMGSAGVRCPIGPCHRTGGEQSPDLGSRSVLNGVPG
jgi:hypothetical protein